MLGWAQGLSSLFIFPPLIAEASWSGQLTARSAASHHTQKYLFAIIGIFFSFSTALSMAPAETALGFCPSASSQTPLLSLLLLILPQRQTSAHVALHTSTSKRARSPTKTPRWKSSCLSPWHARSHRLRAHTPSAFPPESKNNTITEQLGHTSQQQDGFQPHCSSMKN